MDLNLTGRRALVCGSTQGMGRAIAMQLASQGARVSLIARDEEQLQKVLSELPGSGHDYLVANFDDLDAVKNEVKKGLQSGDYHILINNTGGPKSGKIYDAGIEEFETAMRRHLHVSHTLTQEVLPGMRKSGFGRIVNITSTSVKIPIPGLGVSNTVRGAMASWAKTMANELAGFGVTVNNILPGFISTQRITDLVKQRAESSGRKPEEIRAEMLASIPAGRFGEAEEVADFAGFLCSPSGAYINGVSVPVDGGRTGSI